MWTERNGPSYRIRDLVGGRKVTVESGFKTEKAANDRRHELEVDARRGEALVHRGGQVLLNEWLDLWFPTYEESLKFSGQVSARGLLSRYIRPMLGEHTLDEITAMEVQKWVNNLKAGRYPVRPRKDPKRAPRKTINLSRKTAANAHGLLSKIMSEAIVARLIKVNPCTTTRLGQKVHHEMTFLTEQEADRLVKAIPKHYKALILLLLGTGLRWGEAIGLRVKDVDVLARKLRVRKNLQELADNAEIVEEEPKTTHSRRTVTFTKDVALVLVPLVVDKDPEAHVFLAPKGGDVRYRVFWPLFDKARKAAGLPACRIHDLRHTHAAWLISARIRGGLTAVQRRLGHASYTVTSDLYGHLMTEVDDDIMDALDVRMPKLDVGDESDPRGAVGESVGQERSIQVEPSRSEPA